MKPGDTVDEHDFLIREASKQFQTFGSITLLIDGDKISTVSCDDPRTLPRSFSGCSDKISVKFVEERANSDSNGKSDQEDTSLVSSLINRIQALFNRPDSDEYFTANVRDVGSLEDAVLRKEGNTIDWTPAFNHLSKGEFEAQVGEGAKINFSWIPSQSSVSAMNDLGTGLQKLHIETTDGEVVGDVWVLIEGPQTFSAKAVQFAELKKRTSAWRPEVPSSGVEAVLRGGLTELAR